MRHPELALVLLVVSSGCSQRASAVPSGSEPASIAVELTAAPSASTASLAPPSATTSAQAPCPPEDPRRIREGTGVLNASPFDLPQRALAPGEQPAGMPTVSFASARASVGATVGDFALWLDDDNVWHIRANGKKTKPGTSFQARVEPVADVAPEGAPEPLMMHSKALVVPGRCWNDPPRASETQRRAGFDWQSTAGSAGIRFTTPEACFHMTLRLDGKQELPKVGIGSTGTTPNAGKHQDTVEICR